MLDCQIIESQASSCPNCIGKDLTITKCMQLIGLLKKKAKRYDDSKIRDSQSLSSNTVKALPLSQEDLKAKILSFTLRQIERRYALEAFQTIKRYDTKQGENVHFSKGIFGKQIKDKFGQIQTNQSLHEPSNFRSQLLPFIPFPFDQSYEVYQKNRLKSEFQMMVENRKLIQRVQILEQELEESLRRQQKEIAKKRQSLSGLVEELSEKNEIIEELRASIKWLENKLGAKQNGILQCMLEEDSQALRKVVFRLENINDKLNIDLGKIKNEKTKIQIENKQMKVQLQIQKIEIKALKEENFQLEHEKLHINASKKQLQFMSHKINGKVEKILKLQKKWSIASKSKEQMKSVDLQNVLVNKSTKKATTQSTDSLQTASQHSQQMEHKLQAVLIFLFHIEDSSFQLGSPQLFDEEQKQLLAAHKQRYFEKLNHSFIAKKSPRDIGFDGDRQQFNPFGDSVIDAFNHDLKPSIHEKDKKSDKMKLIESSIEHGKLIEKISELKERNLYVRNVILTLLKTLEIKSIKKQTEGILTMLSDYFEYSETERNLIYQPKSKKIFGFI